MNEFAGYLQAAVSRPMVGWDLSYDGRITSTSPDWDFAGMVVAHARRSPDLLDMGTGGGERLSALPYRPPRTVATEGWAPNIPVARERLQPLGIEVVAVEAAPDNVDQEGREDGGPLPFPDASFHLVINRHESYVPAEVARVLAPGGTFLTQQVGRGATGGDLYRLLTGTDPTPPARPWTRAFAIQQLVAAGFTIADSGEGDSLVSFADVGAVVWYLTNLPWELPDFSVATDRDALWRLHLRMTETGPLTVRQPRFWVEARKPEPTGANRTTGLVRAVGIAR